MMQKQLVALAAFGSAALLAGAFLFQLLGYAPCQMCYWQRYPHAVALGAGLMFWLLPIGAFVWVGAIAAATTSAIGVFHAGVEQKWWEGPSGCSGGGGGLSGLTGDALLSTDVVERIVMCDEIAWQFAGLSMAAWNSVLSFALAVIWIAASRQSAPLSDKASVEP